MNKANVKVLFKAGTMETFFVPASTSERLKYKEELLINYLEEMMVASIKKQIIENYSWLLFGQRLF